MRLHPNMALQLHAILAIPTTSSTIPTAPAGVQRDPAHDAGADVEAAVFGFGAEGDDCAGPFVGGGLREFGAEGARGDHAVGVAV